MKKYIFIFSLMVFGGQINGAEYQKDGATILMVDSTSNRPRKPQYSNHVYIKLTSTPAWSNGGGDCHDEWVALQKDDYSSLSVALAALGDDRQVLVRIDDSLPKVGGTHCQVTTIAAKRALSTL